jgi:hypothetical protein
MYNVRSLPWLLAQKEYRAGKASAAGYTQLHCALFTEGATRIQEFYAKHTNTGFIPRAVLLGLVMNKCDRGLWAFCQSMILPGPPCTFIYHKTDRNCPVGAAVPTEEPLPRRNARMTKNAEQIHSTTFPGS